MKKCEFCGSSIKDSETTCPNCGGFLGVSETEEKFENSAEENIPKSAKKAGKAIFIIDAVLIIAVFIVFIVMAVNIFRRGNRVFERVSEGFNNKPSVSYFIND
jgi:uncharacterized membrane protein YvbJ